MSEQRRRAGKALEYLGYSLPEDKYKLRDTMMGLSLEHLTQIKEVLEHEYGFALKIMQDILDSVVFTTCTLCEREESSYGDIPDEWGWYDAGVGWYMLCDECQFRYLEKFGKEPKIVRDI